MARPVLKEGVEAPDFTLPSTGGRPRSLSSLKGVPVVLYFYPQDHTPGCTIQAQRFRDYFEAISIHEAAILGVSRDTLDNHCSFRDAHALPFELLSDEDASVHDLYGAWTRGLLGGKKVRRCTYLIGPDGHIAKTYPKVNVLGHARSVVNDLEDIGHEKAWFASH